MSAVIRLKEQIETQETQRNQLLNEAQRLTAWANTYAGELHTAGTAEITLHKERLAAIVQLALTSDVANPDAKAKKAIDALTVKIAGFPARIAELRAAVDTLRSNITNRENEAEELRVAIERGKVSLVELERREAVHQARMIDEEAQRFADEAKRRFLEERERTAGIANSTPNVIPA